MQKFTFFLVKLYKKLPVIVYDILAIPLAWYLTYWLRFNMQLVPSHLTRSPSLCALTILTLIQIGCYYHFKVYRGLWRFSSLNDVIRIIKAVTCAVLVTVLILSQTSFLIYIPRSVFALYSLVLITLLNSGRLLLRYHWERPHSALANEQRVLVIGAGRAAEGLVRDLKRSSTYGIVGLVDDNPTKKGLEIHGFRVLGTIDDLQNIIQIQQVNLIFIAIPSARSAEMRRIVDFCEGSKISFRTLPSISALVDGRVEVNALRAVHIEDLLGRDLVHLQWPKIAANVQGKRVVVTGGGGSIGAELCRQVMALRPKSLLVIDNFEYNLYSISAELKERYPQISLEISLASVTDSVAISFLFDNFKPELVFHAAAYKHVPMLEEQVRLAVYNNVIGTQIVSEASVAIGVEKFILISTDKAVNPTNVMGTTKRIAEIYCQNLNERVDTKFITVRFGNVLGSAGSVVPLFQKQLQKGGPLTVTHPDIERYFMTIPEACQLILQAMINGHGGEIFVLDMGEPIKIRYLAEQMIRLAGKQPEKEIAIEYIGLRPGEKLYEELFHASEELAHTEHKKLFKAKFRRLNWQELTQAIRLLNTACTLHNTDELYVLIKSLVPEFNSSLETIS